MARNVRRLELARMPHQNSRHVHGDVPHTDHDRPGRAEEWLRGPVRRVPVVPADYRGRRNATRQILSRDVESAIGSTADGDENLVVRSLELVHGEVAPDLDVAEEAKSLAL